MRYFKLVEISEEEYLKMNCSEYNDTNFEQAFTPIKDDYYIAINNNITDKIEIYTNWMDKRDV